MPNHLPPQASQTLEQALENAERYFQSTNDILGVFAFASAVACVGTENPKFFAIITAVFSITAWLQSFWSYRRQLKTLRNAGIPNMQFWPVMRRSIVAVFGWLILGLVLSGFLNKYGFDTHPERQPLTYHSSGTPNGAP